MPPHTAWIAHVQQVRAAGNLTYKEALTAASATYRSQGSAAAASRVNKREAVERILGASGGRRYRGSVNRDGILEVGQYELAGELASHVKAYNLRGDDEAMQEIRDEMHISEALIKRIIRLTVERYRQASNRWGTTFGT
jgi:hypothetical protein